MGNSPQSLLQPGETLGTPVQAPAVNPNSLLQPGETLGTPVAPPTPGGSDNWSNWNPDQLLTSYGAANRAAIGGLASDTLNAVKSAAAALKPTPQSDEETQAFKVGGVGGMLVHRMLSSLSPVGQAAMHPGEIIAAIHDINQSKDPIGTYAKLFQRTASQGAGAAVTAIATEGAAKGVGTVASKVPGAIRAVTGSEGEPGLIQQATQGKSVAQPGAQAAIRQGVQTSTEASGTADESLAANIENQPLVEGHNTVVDEHLSNLAENEKAAYKQMDDAAGFDVKAEKQQLANDQYKLKQLGNTDADITAKGNLIESINDSQARIAQAESDMQKAGVDPKAADAIHQQRMAGQEFKKSLVKNTNPADQTVSVDGLLRDAKALRFGKYGDRLEQFFGSKDAADAYVGQLNQMQQLGVRAAKVQDFGNMAKSWLIKGAAGTAGYEGYKAVKDAISK
jgi:hypothetical protein